MRLLPPWDLGLCLSVHFIVPVMSCLLGPHICPELSLTGQLLNSSWIIRKISILPLPIQQASESFIIFRFFFRECKLSHSFSAFLDVSHVQTDLNSISLKTHACINFKECLWPGEILKEVKMLMMLRNQESACESVHFWSGGLQRCAEGLRQAWS